jgi:hypothetical protein
MSGGSAISAARSNTAAQSRSASASSANASPLTSSMPPAA